MEITEYHGLVAQDGHAHHEEVQYESHPCHGGKGSPHQVADEAFVFPVEDIPHLECSLQGEDEHCLACWGVPAQECS